MTDFDFNSEIVVLGGISELGYTHDSVEVTVTDTMQQGSLLDSDGLEVATADAANVAGAIDDLMFRRHADDLETDDVLTVAVAKRGLILNTSALVYTDGDIDTAGQTALAAAGMNKFGTVADSTDVI